MTTSKTLPDPKQHTQSGTPPTLGDSIDTLDHIITDEKPDLTTTNENMNIPVLDDIVEPGNPADIAMTSDIKQWVEEITSTQIAELVNNMDGKISRELDSLINILKDTIKESIMNELKIQLEIEINKVRSQGHSTDD